MCLRIIYVIYMYIGMIECLPMAWVSIPGQVTPKTQKMVLDASLLNTQHSKVWIKDKVEQSRERSSALPYTLV